MVHILKVPVWGNFKNLTVNEAISGYDVSVLLLSKYIVISWIVYSDGCLHLKPSLVYIEINWIKYSEECIHLKH